MGYRFRRRIKIARGLSLNLSGSGLSVTTGMRGASVTYGSKGTHLNLSVAGTGLGYRARLNGFSNNDKKTSDASSVSFSICDDGSLIFTDKNGNLVDPRSATKLKSQYRTSIEAELHRDCERRNQQLNAVREIHLSTLNPKIELIYTPKTFHENYPFQPQIKKYGLLGALFKSIRKKIDHINHNVQVEYEAILQDWNLKKQEHDLIERAIESLYSFERFQNAEGMMKCLDHRLSEVEWPLETEATYELSEDLKTIFMDVDLPEVEDMPSQTANVSSRSLKISLKNLSDTEIRKSYMLHTHGIIFRLIGEVFVCLPMIEKIIISGYSQRLNKTTMHINDEYLLSVAITRSTWSAYDFNSLTSVDVCNTFDSCDLRRDMSKTGVFKPIIPFDRKLNV